MHQYFDIKLVQSELLSDGETTSVVLPKAEVTLVKRDQHNSLKGSHLIDLAWTSLFCEQVSDIEYLANLADHPITEWCSVRCRTFFELQMVMLGIKSGDVRSLIQKFIDVSTPEHLEGLAFEHANLVDLPTINVMTKVLNQSGCGEVEYQQAMYEAVKKHHKYWSQKKLKEEVTGYFAMPLLTLAKLAYQKYGFRLGFETDYVPEAFYTRNMPEPSYSFLEKYKDLKIPPALTLSQPFDLSYGGIKVMRHKATLYLFHIIKSLIYRLNR
ncbi:Imm49 family immunity protein [Vibrio sp. AND4]|uniref:Imm49 family immunity protein n=1 Tax=Vibrio sp. AND4 TaxID=314289 RepID=UPI001F499970|nr:Imm49 family immunity protein [Vibrio sp. AND4]